MKILRKIWRKGKSVTGFSWGMGKYRGETLFEIRYRGRVAAMGLTWAELKICYEALKADFYDGLPMDYIEHRVRTYNYLAKQDRKQRALL